MLDFAIFAVTFLTVLIVAIIWLYPSSQRITTIPGLDPSTKEDGNLSDISRAGSLHQFLQEVHARFGPITAFWWGQKYVVSIASPALFKQHSAVFDKPTELFRMFEPLLGAQSIQFANGTEGRTRRQHYDRAFSHDKFHIYYEKFNKVASSIENRWLEKSREDHIALSEDMFVYAIKASLLTLLGESFTDDKLVLSFRNAYDKAWSEMEHSLSDPFNLLDEKSSKVTQFKAAVQYLKATIEKVVKHRQDKCLNRHGRLLIDDIIDCGANDEVITCDALTYAVAAFHTTANLLTWCFYFLATHKDVQDKLNAEINRVMADADIVQQAHFEELSYLNQVLDESLRCAVVAPWGARVQDFDSELGGHTIPKGTPVIQAFGVVLQDEALWPLPNKFDPERFSAMSRESRSSYDFVPFGFAGKRKCPGHKFAYSEAATLVVSLIRRFEVHLLEDQVVQPVYGLVTHPMDEVWVKVTRRSK